MENCSGKVLVEFFGKMPYLISLNPQLLKNIAYFGSLYLSLSVSVCLSVSLHLGHCHHQMISFQKIYGLYGLEHHNMEINRDVTMQDEQTAEQR